MILSGHDVFIEKGHWVNEGVLRKFYPGKTLNKITRLIENPNYPAYCQMGILNDFKRIDMGRNWAMYIRLHSDIKTVAILAFTPINKTKRDEHTGELNPPFINYLIAHRSFIPQRFVPLDGLAIPTETNEPVTNEDSYEKEEEVVAVAENVAESMLEPVLDWAIKVKFEPLTEQKAMTMVFSQKRAAPQDPYCLRLLEKVLMNPDGRVLFPFPAESENWEKKQFSELTQNVKRTLAWYRLTNSVRTDMFSRKFLIVPKGQEVVYCYGGKMPRRAVIVA